jgi:hypothetical protein
MGRPYIFREYFLLKNSRSLTQEFSWTNPEHLPVSDTLLSIIEDSATYKTALGFDKGDVGLVRTGAKNLVNIYREIACKVFIDVPVSKYTKDDLEELKDIIRNRITAYVTQHNPTTFAYTASQDEEGLQVSSSADVRNRAGTFG